eukprot:750608-Hanusia_phi.AAC.1
MPLFSPKECFGLILGLTFVQLRWGPSKYFCKADSPCTSLKVWWWWLVDRGSTDPEIRGRGEHKHELG